MIVWKLFYKTLGIPDDLTEPTFYDLLGLHAETCDPERVDQMLLLQKKRLRQNLSSQQFVPLVLSFEKNTLERAAAVLRDPNTREKYNQYLRHQADQKERDRLRLVQRARDVVNSLLNPDKTLYDSKRPILAARLRELGIGEITVNSLIKRIPRPASTAAKPDAEAMTYSVATCTSSVPQEERSDSAESFYTEERAGNVVTEQLVTMPQWTRRLRNTSPVVPLILIMGGFAIFVWFFMWDGNGSSPQWRPPVTETSAAEKHSEPHQEPSQSNTATEAEGNPSNDEETHAGSLNAQAVHECVSPTEEAQAYTEPPSAGHRVPIPGRMIVTAEDVRQAYSNSARTEELLADLAMTLLACSCRATQFALGSTECFDELRTLMNEPNRSSYLTRAVTIVPMTPVTSVAKSAPPTAGQSEPKSPGARSKSSQSSLDPIEWLRREDTPEAADRLLKNLRIRSLRAPEKFDMVCRILHALSTMTDSNIPQRLIEMLPRSSPEVAFQITRTLARASGTTPSDGRFMNGLLPLVNTPVQRQRYARWWTRHYPVWGRLHSMRSTVSEGGFPVAIQTSPGTTSAWGPDPTTIKLLAMTAHYAEMTGEALKNNPLETGAPIQAQGFMTRTMGVTNSAAGVGMHLLDSLNDISKALSRIITLHPNHAQTASMMDAIKLHQKDPRAAACENPLQQVVVNLDAIADLLIVLLRQADRDDELNNILARIEAERNSACILASNVVYELRESCYYNLALWDKIIEYGIIAPTLVQTRMPIRSSR